MDAVFVTAATSGNAERAFSTAGGFTQLGADLRGAAVGPVLMIELATLTPRRRASDLKTHTSSISSGDDGGALLVSVNQSGDTTISFLDEPRQIGGIPLASLVGSNVINLKGLMMPGATDFLSSSNPLELRFRAKLRRTIDNSEIRSSTLHVDGYNDFVGAPELPIITAVPRPGTYVELYVYEDDGAWGDDDLGTYTFTVGNTSSMNWQYKSAFFPKFQAIATQFRCGYVSPTYGTFLCPWNLPDGTVTSWREVNFNVEWQPYQNPPATIGVTGPFNVQAFTTQSYTVNFVPGGTAPYSYRWYRDGVLVGTGSSVSLSFPTPSTYHAIVVDVTDGGEFWQQREFNINVNTGECEPGDPECFETIRAAPPSDSSPQE